MKGFQAEHEQKILSQAVNTSTLFFSPVLFASVDFILTSVN